MRFLQVLFHPRPWFRMPEIRNDSQMHPPSKGWRFQPSVSQRLLRRVTRSAQSDVSTAGSRAARSGLSISSRPHRCSKPPHYRHNLPSNEEKSACQHLSRVMGLPSGRCCQRSWVAHDELPPKLLAHANRGGGGNPNVQLPCLGEIKKQQQLGLNGSAT